MRVSVACKVIQISLISLDFDKTQTCVKAVEEVDVEVMTLVFGEAARVCVELLTNSTVGRKVKVCD